jgi:uncharacterized delta-60 repeat protein
MHSFTTMRRHLRNTAALLCLILCPAALLAADTDFDPAFNGAGNDYIIGGAPAETDSTSALCVQADGKLVLAGVHTFSLFSHAVRVYRRNANGGADLGFTPASVPVSIASVDAIPYAPTCAIQPDGKILFSAINLPRAANELVVYRLNANGTPDDGFGPGGRRAVVYDLVATPNLEIAEVLAQADGRIVLVGTHRVDTLTGAMVAMRLDANGSPDLSYGTRGQVLVTRFAELQGGTPRDQAWQAWLAPDGGVLVGGSTARVQATLPPPFPATVFRAHIGLAKLTTLGLLDPSFGNGGVVDFDAGTTVNGLLDGAILPGGKIGALARTASGAQSGRDPGRELFRFHATGALDLGFGQLGRATLDLPGALNFGVHALAAQGDSLLAAGFVVAGNATDTLVVRLRADGTRDPAFSTGEYGAGIAALRTGNQNNERAWAVGVQGGKPVIAGDLRIGPNTTMHYLYRLTPTATELLRDGFESP